MTGPRAEAVLVCGWLLNLISISLIIARFYLRLKIQRRKPILSDVLMCLAWVFSAAATSFITEFHRLGVMDPHVTTLLVGFDGDFQQMTFVFKLFWISNFPFVTALYFSKSALLAAYDQIIPPTMKKRRIAFWFTVGYVAASYLASILLQLLICRPIKTNWDLDPLTKCSIGRSGVIVFRIGWVLHFVGDVLVFFLPWLVITGLNVKPRVRMGLYGAFLLGIISLTFCIIRFYTFEQSVKYFNTPITYTMLWSALELNMTLIIACLPSLGPYLSRRSSASTGARESQSSRKASRVSTIPLRRESEFDGQTVASLNIHHSAHRNSRSISPTGEMWEESKANPC